MYELYAAAIILPVAGIVCWRFAVAFGAPEKRSAQARPFGGATFLQPLDRPPNPLADQLKVGETTPTPSVSARRRKKQPAAEELVQPIKPALTKRTRIGSGLRYPLQIRYCDAEGIVTERAITVQGVTQLTYGTPTLSAFCHQRNAVRSFRVGQIIEAIDSKTGEVLTDIVGRMREVAAERTTQVTTRPSNSR